MFEWDIETYFLSTRQMMKNHNFSISEINELSPWRLKMYISIINAEIEYENLKNQSK
jgi:hypothetical protein